MWGLSKQDEHFLTTKYFPPKVWGLVECCIGHLDGCRQTCWVERYAYTAIVAPQKGARGTTGVPRKVPGWAPGAVEVTWGHWGSQSHSLNLLS